jgi:hypothetical protein
MSIRRYYGIASVGEGGEVISRLSDSRPEAYAVTFFLEVIPCLLYMGANSAISQSFFR